jgi:DNA-binding transcriptional LysR family regulator
MNTTSWDDFRHFLAIHRTGTLSAAARVLKVDQTTVSRRLVALEESLGSRLFDRTPDGLVLTPAGARALPEAERIEECFTGLERRASGEDARLEGTVRITCVEDFAFAVLLPGLARIRTRYPNIRLEVLTGAEVFDLARREADIAIRVERPVEPELVMRKLPPMAFALYGSRAYLKRQPFKARTLQGRPLVAYEEDIALIDSDHWFVRAAAEGEVVLRTSTTLLLMSAIQADLGVAALPCFLGDREPELRRAWKEPIFNRESWLVYHGDQQQIARVRVIADAIFELTQEKAPVLRGEG